MKSPTPDEIFGLRFNSRLTQREFGAMINLSARTIQDYEAGRRKCHPAIYQLMQLVFPK